MLRCMGSISRSACRSGVLAYSCLFLILAAARASTEFVIPPGPAALPSGIVEGSDGNLWVTEAGRGSIARLTPSGQLTEFPVPGAVNLNKITLGPDGKIWFIDSGSCQ